MGPPGEAVNCTTTAPPSPESCLLADAPGSREKGISVPHREEPLPQKRVVLSRTLRTAAPLSGYVRLSHIRMPNALLPMPSFRVAFASAQLERTEQRDVRCMRLPTGPTLGNALGLSASAA